MSVSFCAPKGCERASKHAHEIQKPSGGHRLPRRLVNEHCTEDMGPVRCLLTLVYMGTSLRECCRERIVDVAAHRGNVWNA